MLWITAFADLFLCACDFCFRSWWNVWRAGRGSWESASLPHQTLRLLSLQMVSITLSHKSCETLQFFCTCHNQKIKKPFPPPALKALRDVTTLTTWLQSPSSRLTARCGTRLSPSPVSKWSTCWPASLWSERSRRSSVPAETTWAKLRGLTGLVGTCFPVLLTMQYPSWLCKPQWPSQIKWINNHHSLRSVIFFFSLLNFHLMRWTVLFFLLTAFVSHYLCNLFEMASREASVSPTLDYYWAYQRW